MKIYKKLITMVMTILLVLAMLCSAYAEDYISIVQLREEVASGWHETYTTSKGKEIEINVDIHIPEVKTVPAVIVKGNQLEPQRLTRFAKADVADGFLMAIYGDMKSESKGQHLSETDFLPGCLNEMPQQAQNGMSYEEVCSIFYAEMNDLFGKSRADFEPFSATMHHWENGDSYFLRFAQKVLGIPSFSHLFTYNSTSATCYAFNITHCEVDSIPYEDLPLCSFSQIEKALKVLMDKEKIDGVLSVQLVYQCFENKKANQQWLLPVWLVYCSNGTKKDRMTGEENPRIESYCYNAQTGELISQNDETRTYAMPKVVTWDKVK